MRGLGIVRQCLIASLCPAVALLLIAFGATGLSAEEEAKTYLLRYQFEPGTIVTYTVKNRSQIELQHDEAVQQIDHQQTSTKHYRVISADAEGNGTLELTIDRVQMSASADGGEAIEFDSESDKIPPSPFVRVAGTVGKPHVRISAAPTGELLTFSWLANDEEDAAEMKPDTANLEILVRLPDQAVAIGETWKERFETKVTVEGKLRKNVTMLRTYRLVSVEDDRATIELQTSVITPLNDPAQEAQLIQMAPDGTIEFNLKRGLLLSRSTQLDKTVVGFNGAKSRMRNVTTRSERFVSVEKGESSLETETKPAQSAQKSTGQQR